MNALIFAFVFVLVAWVSALAFTSVYGVAVAFCASRRFWGLLMYCLFLVLMTTLVLTYGPRLFQ